MKRSRKKILMDKGWLLPENPFPEETICVQFEIPRDLQYVAVINGLLADLGKWWNWEKGGEGDRRATDVAAMFRKMIYETLCIEDYHEMGCNCNDPQTYLHRITPEGVLQRSTNGGTTWETDPTDPRLTALDMPPLPGADSTEKQCQAAFNIRTHFQERATQLASDASLWAGINGMLAAVIGILLFIGVIGSAGALTPLALSLGAALLAAGQVAFTAAMTTAVFDTFQCIVYCHMPQDGQLTEEAIAAIKADIGTQLTGIAVTFFDKNLTLLGLIGVNNMAATDSNGTANCTSCEPCNDTTLYFFNGANAAVPITPDENGVYTVVCDSYSANGYYGTIAGSPDYAADGYTPCFNPSFISSGGAGLSVKLDCGTGTSNPLSTCVSVYQLFSFSPWTATFTAEQCGV